MITRRSMLTGGSAALALAACSTTPTAPPERVYSRQPWAFPRVSEAAVIREVVGHRPWRPPGFRVEREVLDSKVVVHNYGHGGGGLSLGWGSSALALRALAEGADGEASGPSGAGPVAVIGSGIMGLTSARLLQDAGREVTIYTRDVYRHTTSNVAAGEWGPYATHDPSLVDEGFIQRLHWAARIAHHAYTNLAGPRYGIRFLENYELRDRPPPAERGEPDPIDRLYAYARDLAPGAHPFGDRWARVTVTMQIDPGTLLRQLTQDFQVAGGRFVIRNFADRDEVLSLDEPVIFNCTGLGARALFGDEDLVPAKGQLVFLPPDPAVDYMTIGGGRGNLYMFPRSDVLLLGGTFKVGDWSSHPEPEDTQRIIDEHRRLFDAAGLT